jgi:hypothetical protein
MNTTAEKTPAPLPKSAASVPEKKRNKETPSAFQDNRAETLEQRNLQETASKSSLVQQQQAMQLMANASSSVAQMEAAPIQMRTESSIKADLLQGAYASQFNAGFTANHVLPAGNTNFDALKHHSGRAVRNNTIIADARALKDQVSAGRWTLSGTKFVAVANAAIGVRKTRGHDITFDAAPAAPARLTGVTHPATSFTLGEEAGPTGAMIPTVTAITGVTATELNNAKTAEGRGYPKKEKRAAYRVRLLNHINGQRAGVHQTDEVAWVHANFSHINGVPLVPGTHNTKALINAIPALNSVVTVWVDVASGEINHLANS